MTEQSEDRELSGRVATSGDTNTWINGSGGYPALNTVPWLLALVGAAGGMLVRTLTSSAHGLLRGFLALVALFSKDRERRDRAERMYDELAQSKTTSAIDRRGSNDSAKVKGTDDS